MRGYIDIVQDLIRRGADVNVNPALIFASQNGRVNVVRELLNAGANIHARDDQSLIFAAANGKLSMVKYLLDHGANIHAQNNAALSFVVTNYSQFGESGTRYRNYLEVIQYLLGRGANINVLSLEFQQLYQHWVPKVITWEYYLIESSTESIEESSDRYILYPKKGVYIVQK
jgi:hypothetical protein